MCEMEDSSFRQRLEAIEERIESACERAGRERSSVELLAVSKTHAPESVAEASACGLSVFGESRVQEAMKKIPMCCGSLRWHLIGHLQTNKAKHVARLFDMVHSVDSLRVMEALEKSCAQNGKLMPITLEVNISGEGTKYGLAPADVCDALSRANALPHLEPVGLMTMPPFTPDPEKSRGYFSQLREMRDECEQKTGIPLPELSMGMSHDFEVAIEEGATWIRLGTILFGKRGSVWRP